MGPKNKKGFQKGNVYAIKKERGCLKNGNLAEKKARFPPHPAAASSGKVAAAATTSSTTSRTNRICSCYFPETCREIQNEYLRLGIDDRVGYTTVAKSTPKPGQPPTRYEIYRNELIRQRQNDLEDVKAWDSYSVDGDKLTVAYSHFPPAYLEHHHKGRRLFFDYKMDGFGFEGKVKIYFRSPGLDARAKYLVLIEHSSPQSNYLESSPCVWAPSSAYWLL